MQRVIVDCQSKKETIEELAPDEVAARLLEIEKAKEQEKSQRVVETKRALARELAELKEMKLNNIFDDKDIEEKQMRIDELKSSILPAVHNSSV